MGKRSQALTGEAVREHQDVDVDPSAAEEINRLADGPGDGLFRENPLNSPAKASAAWLT